MKDRHAREAIVVIGGGPAGLAAALAAACKSRLKVILIERDRELGGILNQCVHDGFGNFVFGESLTGPEYASRFIEQLQSAPNLEVWDNTAVISLKGDRTLTAVNRSGIHRLKPAAIILAMGCRERSRYQAFLPGYRPAGVYTAGTVQRLVNMEGVMPGEKAVILGSGDIGLIMARRLTLEGAEVLGVYEIMNRPGGLTRNIVQCLEDFNIPLFLSHQATFLHGKKRLEGVSIAPYGSSGKPDLQKEKRIECDTLILSVGLIPENELSREAGIEIDPATAGPVVDQDMATGVEGIFACGNVVHVSDLVDHVTLSAQAAGRGAARYLSGRKPAGKALFKAGTNIARLVPQVLSLPVEDKVDLYIRVSEPAEYVRIAISSESGEIYNKKERIVRPPEMIHLQLEKELFQNTGGGDSLFVNLQGGEADGG